jgi:hypothetical protein
MSSRAFEQLYIPLNNAEVTADAPRQDPSTFPSLLTSLQGEIEPILQRRFGTSDINSLRTQALSQPTTTKSSDPSSSQPTIGATISSLLPRAPPRQSQPKTRPASEALRGIDDILASLSSAARGRDPSSSSLSETDRRYRLLGQSPSSPNTSSLTSRLSQQIASTSPSAYARAGLEREQLRLKPELGRTVEVTTAGELTRAFRSLEAKCSRNGVRSDSFDQKFHVRRGQMRKNVRIKRWRKMFMDGFLEECKRVRRMRRQGW